MKKQLNPHARKGAVYVTCCACFVGWPILLRGHRSLMLTAVGLQMLLLVMAIIELKKSKAVHS